MKSGLDHAKLSTEAAHNILIYALHVMLTSAAWAILTPSSLRRLENPDRENRYSLHSCSVAI